MQRIVFVLLAGALLGGCGGKEESKEKEGSKEIEESALKRASAYSRAARLALNQIKEGVPIHLNGGHGTAGYQSFERSQLEFFHARRAFDFSGIIKGGADKKDFEVLLNQVHLVENYLIEAGFAPFLTSNNTGPIRYKTPGGSVHHVVHWNFSWPESIFIKDEGKDSRSASVGFPSLKITRTYLTADSGATLHLIVTLFPPSRELQVEVLYTDRTVLSAAYPKFTGSMRDEIK